MTTSPRLHPIAQIVLYREGRFLLTKRKVEADDNPVWDGYWQIPTGTLEFGEDIQKAVTREAKEELGIDVELERTLAVTEKVDEEQGWHGVFMAFLCRQKDPTQQIQINHEAYEYAWLTPAQILKLQVIPSTLDTIRYVIRYYRLFQLGALAVIQHDQKYLLTKIYAPKNPEAHGRWGFVAGITEPQERLEQTIQRESREEVGIDVTVTQMIPYVVEHDNFKLFCYLAVLKDVSQQVRINDEASDWRWMTSDEICALPDAESYGQTKQIIECVEAMKAQ